MDFNFSNISNDLNQYSDVLENNYRPQRQTVVCCENCGTTLDDFLKSGFVGCAECYKTFAKEARDFAADIHGRALHIGKVPKTEATKAMRLRELEALISEKDAAVKAEDYIKADELKKKIYKLKGDV